RRSTRSSRQVTPTRQREVRRSLSPGKLPADSRTKKVESRAGFLPGFLMRCVSRYALALASLPALPFFALFGAAAVLAALGFFAPLFFLSVLAALSALPAFAAASPSGASVGVSTRSMSSTSAIGALSPRRNPTF